MLFRSATFEPRFQKHAGAVCHGAELIITDRSKIEALLLGMVILEALLLENPEQFEWRTETYEYVDDPIAIDLLFGTAQGRLVLEERRAGDVNKKSCSMRELLDEWNHSLSDFMENREACLIY